MKLGVNSGNAVCSERTVEAWNHIVIYSTANCVPCNVVLCTHTGLRKPLANTGALRVSNGNSFCMTDVTWIQVLMCLHSPCALCASTCAKM